MDDTDAAHVLLHNAWGQAPLSEQHYVKFNTGYCRTGL
ncbi:hypothetical protein CBA19C6_03410 [Cupriavidus pauculus]|nr:hypothetical protein CBA19C6_03410 [Cupriavidus pauculus]